MQHTSLNPVASTSGLSAAVLRDAISSVSARTVVRATAGSALINLDQLAVWHKQDEFVADTPYANSSEHLIGGIKLAMALATSCQNADTLLRVAMSGKSEQAQTVLDAAKTLESLGVCSSDLRRVATDLRSQIALLQHGINAQQQMQDQAIELLDAFELRLTSTATTSRARH